MFIKAKKILNNREYRNKIRFHFCCINYNSIISMCKLLLSDPDTMNLIVYVTIKYVKLLVSISN